MRSPNSSRKSIEGFVQWKQSHTSQDQGENSSTATSKSGGSQSNRGIYVSSTSRGGRTVSPSLLGRGRPLAQCLHNSSESQGGNRQNSSLSAKNVDSNGQTTGGRKQDVVGTNAKVIGNSTSERGSPASTVRQKLPANREYAVNIVSNTPTQTLPRATIIQKNFVNSANLRNMQREVLSRTGGVPCTDDRSCVQKGRRMPLSWRGQTHNILGSLSRGETATSMEDEDQGLYEQNEECEDDGSAEGDFQVQSKALVYGFDNDDLNDDIIPASSKEGDAGGVQETTVEDVRDVLDWAVSDESAKRKERRQAQAAREREGDRRRKAGLRRNYLMVDEYTKKPYGPGVGEWRKELMLLSRDLDPAIGNINRQPDGAVAEIAEWIQHTWEYSEPIKFEFVKEVVARGVTLRRADLWKKIRNNEPKPEKLSDRSWRSLSRQLESDATIKKSKSCSRANAARVNFGRTGPSGEVGVQERLRRKLRRSPEPEEINREMARNKGYGGRSKRTSNYGDVMRGSQEDARLGMQVAHRGKSRSDMYNVTVAEENDVGEKDDIDDEVNTELHCGRGSDDRVSQRQVMNMTEQEISQHPLVLKMMERLEALEGRQSSAIVPIDSTLAEKVTIEDADAQGEGTGQQANSVKLQDNVHGVELEARTVPRKPGRPRKRARNN